MKRVLGIVLLLAVCGAFVVLASGAGDGGGGDYKIRAIFRNAFTVTKGEDVKIAGVKVGSIESLDVTPDQQAAVVLKITRAGFQDFRADAECTIRPQGLIGERFVECTPTQPRPAGQNPPPELAKIPDGQPGAGQRLLKVSQTSRPVDIDLLNNIMRLPFRQRLSIILNEFGAGLAGRGEDLRSVIRNADPALKSTDKVIKLVADQNKVLADLARDSDVSLGPLARDRQSVADFVVKANDVARATAERRTEFEQQFEKLPKFLAELQPTMDRLGGFADQATPVLDDLGAVAPQVSRFIKALGPFSASSNVALKSLGKATIPGRKALVAAKPIVADLQDFSTVAVPLAQNLSSLLTSLKDTGGIERLMDYIFYQVAAVNGFDSFGHYLRAELILNLCSTYAVPSTANPACSSNFKKPSTSRAASSMSAEDALNQPGRSVYLRRMDAVLRGMSPEEALRRTGGLPESGDDAKTTKADDKGASTTTTETPAATTTTPRAPATTTQEQAPATTQEQPAPATTAEPAAPSAGDDGTTAPEASLLDYLLGGGG